MPEKFSSRHVQWTAIVAASVLLLALVAVVAWPVRRELQSQVLQREAEAVAAVARQQRDIGVSRYEGLGLAPTVDDVFEALLESSRLDGVVAIQLFGPDGQSARELPLEAWVESLAAADRVGSPTARLHSDDEMLVGAGEAMALAGGHWLEVIVPLHLAGESAQGWARYWINGEPVRAELVAVDRQILAITGWAGGLGVVVLVTGLGWAFARLRRQAADLSRANRELLLHTKTAAIGAISAHLIHGLKNPLAGLAGFMAENPSSDGGAVQGDAWREAADTTRRVRTMINEVLGVLQDVRDGTTYTATAGEVIQAALERTSEAVSAAGLTVRLSIDAGHEATAIDGRVAALSGLVIANLLDNAISATPRGGQLTLRVRRVAGGLLDIDLEDTGGGLPEAVQIAAFSPVTSSKPGGAGLGLALSGQLARHAGGSLELVHTGASGTCFRLRLPVAVTVPAERSVR